MPTKSANLFCLVLTGHELAAGAYGHIVGTGAEADVGEHVRLKVKAQLVAVDAVASAVAAGKTSAIKVYAGTSKSGTAVLSSAISLTNATPRGAGTIADPGKIYDEDQEFCISENSTAASNVENLTVTLWFVAHGYIPPS